MTARRHRRPRGTLTKKSPATHSTRSPSPAVCRLTRAGGSAASRSNRTPDRLGLAPRIAARSTPRPPPTSTRWSIPPKSKASTTSFASCSARPAIEASNAASLAGFRPRCSKNRSPCTRSNAVPPPRTVSRRAPAAVVVHLRPGDRRAAQRRQARTHGCEREPPVVILGQHVLDHQPAHHPHQGVTIGTHRSGDLGAGPRSVGEDRGDVELGRHVQQLSGEVTVEQAHQAPRWRLADVVHRQ